MKNNMTKRLLVTLMAAAMLLGASACGNQPAPQGDGQSATQTAALTKDEYAAAFEKMNTSIEEIQTKAGEMDMTDPEAGKSIMEEMKKPLQEFAAIVPPAEYEEAHAQLKLGCESMIGFVDNIVGMIGVTDQDQLKTASEEMQRNVTDAITYMSEGARMLDEIEGN